MRRIFKYPLQATSGAVQSIFLPVGSELLTVQLQYGTPSAWFMVDPDAEKRDRSFVFIMTGHGVPDGLRYVQTFQFDGGDFVLHLFEGVSS